MQESRRELFDAPSIPRAYFALTLPAVLGKVVMLFYNVADTWFIAATGDALVVAGVSLCAPVFMMLIALGDVFGLGGSSLISRLLGRGDEALARRVSAFCAWAAPALGTLMGLALLAFQEPVLRLLGADAGTLPHAVAYLRIIALGAPLSAASIVPLNLLRSEGMAKESMYGSVLGSLVNLLLDPLFIFVLGMGAAGAAAATVLGNAASLVLYGYFIRRRARILTLDIRTASIPWEQVRAVLAVGIPASVNNLMAGFGTALCNRFLLPYGSEKLAAFGIAGKVSMIANMLVVGFTFGAAPLIGYAWGKGDRSRLWAILRFFYGFLLTMSAGAALVLGLLAPRLVGFFMEDPAIVTAGSAILRWQLAGVPFMALVLASACVFQASGKGMAALILSLCRQGVVYLLVMVVLSALLGYRGVISAQCLADALSAGIALALLQRSLGGNIRYKI